MNQTWFIAGYNATQPLMKPEITTTEMLQELCREMDDQAFYTAIAGFVISLLSLFYYSRWRPKLEKSENPWLRPFMDKLLQAGTALMFAVIIVRLLRAG